MPTNDLKSRKFFTIVLVLQFLMYGTVFLDIPVARQIVGFVYLTFIPGIILLRILGLDNLDIAEKILLSVGLSIAFLMFSGLLINELFPLVGISKPLSLMPLITTFSFLLLPFSYFEERRSSTSIKSLELPALLVPFLCLPLLSVLGASLVNNSQGNFVLLFMILMISVLFSLSASRKLLPSRFYPLALITIYIALFLHYMLITSYLSGGGGDLFTEYYVFRTTENNSYWNPSMESADFEIFKSNSMISVTILPAIYSQILAVDGTWVFKIIFPLIMSFLPLGLYQLYRTQTKKMTAFLATFLFTSNITAFIWGPAKQWFGHFFYVLLCLLIFHKKLPPLQRKLLFMIFSAALVVSHYSISYIFMFIVLFTWAFSAFTESANGKISVRLDGISKRGKISVTLVVMFIVMTFAWYVYVSRSAPFNALLNAGGHVIRSISSDFFNPVARGETVLMGIGVIGTAPLVHQIGRMFFYLTEIFIVVGFVRLATKRKELSFDSEFATMASLNLTILVMNVILPGLSSTFLIQRFYIVSLIILAPLCILGAETVFDYILKLKTMESGIPKPDTKEITASVLAVTLLTSLFLFQTGFIYEVTKVESYSIPLSNYRMDEIFLYDRIVTEQQVFGAKWLSQYMSVTNSSLVYGDLISRIHVLVPYGMIKDQHVAILSNTTLLNINVTRTLDIGAFIYLRRLNTIFGEYGFRLWNNTEISSILNSQNKIYSNGECDIYKGYEATEMHE